jgi:polar amino acid transport system substrate-binding protein
VLSKLNINSKYLILVVFFILPTRFALSFEVINLTAGLSKPPFVIANNDSNSGIQLDLIKAIFAEEGKEVSFSHMALARSFSNVEKWHSDGMITVPSEHKYENVFISESYVKYQNVVVTLEEEDITINSLTDLKGKEVIAFQTARKFLGSDYVNAVGQASEYREISDQMRQIKMLFAKRTQALVLDISIFKFFVHNHKGKQYRKPYRVHWLFAPRLYSAGFKNKADCEAFNRGLAKIKANGKYQQILDKYLL